FSSLIAPVSQARADTQHLNIGMQMGLGYLQIYVMRAQSLLQKNAAAMGIKDLDVTYREIGSPVVLNDGILSGSLDVVVAGVPPAIVFWDKTHDTDNPEKIFAALGSQPIYLVSNDPNVKTIGDFTAQQRIAVPAIKVSTQSIILGIAAKKMFGADGAKRFDTMQVAMSHPDAMTALLAGSSIAGDFSSFPFQNVELENPHIHRVMDSYKVLGGPASIFCVWTTKKYYDENPKVAQVLWKSLQEATDFIKRHPSEAIAMYNSIDHSKLPVSSMMDLMKDPEVRFTLAPDAFMQYATYMHESGLITHMPSSWKDMVLPIAWGLPGS
ncbi:MAG: ABC transporter substrate-binding protein, partial [Vulcanimicrobiaceae bacterium]